MEGTYAVRIEEVLGDDCRCAVDYFANLNESYANRFMNSAARTGHPGHRRTGRNHRWLDSGHRDNDHDHRPSAFGCQLSISRHRDSNRRLVTDDLMTIDARYPHHSRIDARPSGSSCFEARSGELGQLSFKLSIL